VLWPPGHHCHGAARHPEDAGYRSLFATMGFDEELADLEQPHA
jgi:hypothetical protein